MPSNHKRGTLTRQYPLRMEQETYDKLAQRAKRENRTVGQMARHILVQGLRKEVLNATR